ncbi:MAG: hypothetical protein JTT11_04050 [Candidatus Brockarchaeota archaeon]|nr:hypothetical protein [Candidatus Brockarchaeota archaeon]
MKFARLPCLTAIIILLSQPFQSTGLADMEPLTVFTGDGLSISFAKDGAIESIAIDGVDLPVPSDRPELGGFSMGEVRGSYIDLSPNLLLNGGFETWDGLADGWNAYFSGYSRGAEPHGGSSSLKASATDASIAAGGYQVVRFGELQPGCRTLKVSGWSRAEAVSGMADDDYSIYVDVTYADGSHLWGQTARFDVGTHGWQYAQKIIELEKPVAELYVYCLFRHHAGTAWFDDICIVETSQAIPRVEGRVARQDREIVETAAMQGSKIGLEARFRGMDRAIKVDVNATDMSGLDRALSLSFSLPLDLTGWIWGNDISSLERISEGGLYRNSQPLGEERWIATYPLASISSPDGRLGLTIAVPMDQPRIVEFQYGRGEFSIKYDFATSGLTRNFPNRAAFTFYIYKNDLPDWAFRGSLKKYYELFPQFFVKRAAKEGIWMPFTPISRVRNPEDFGFMFHEGDSDVLYDNAQGYYAFVYIEPWDYWLDMGSFPREPTPEEALSALMGDVDSADAWRRENARSVIVSGLHDREGRLRFRIVNAPWISGSGWSALFPTNTDPSLPENETFHNKAHVTWSLQLDPAFQRAESSGGSLDGVYLDSFQGYFPDAENFRREHFANVTFPLQWDQQTYEPVLLDLFTHYPLTEEISARMHAQGKLVMANSIDRLSAFFVHLVDIAGIEVNWFPEGRYAPDSDQIFNFRRSIMYQKPYLLLMNTDFDYMTYDSVEAYFKRCAHYAVFPSMFSADASTHPYWENSALYERDRPLFRKYIPIIKALSKAGWEPVTHARVEPSDLGLERYGPSDGTTYFSVHNPSLVGTKNFSLSICPSALPNLEEGVRILEMVGMEEVAFTAGPDGLRLEDEIAPGGTKGYMVRIGPGPLPSQITAQASRETVNEGEPITISGLISPPPGVSTVVVTYARPDGTEVLRRTNCTESGAFIDTYCPDMAGLWHATAEWEGNDALLPSKSDAVQFAVEAAFPTAMVAPVIAVAAAGGLFYLKRRFRRSRTSRTVQTPPPPSDQGTRRPEARC